MLADDVTTGSDYPLEGWDEGACHHSRAVRNVPTAAEVARSALTPAADHTGPPRQQAAVAPYLATDTCEASLETTWTVWTTSVLVAQFCLPVCGNMDVRSTLSSSARCRPARSMDKNGRYKSDQGLAAGLISTLKTAATGETCSVMRWERSRQWMISPSHLNWPQILAWGADCGFDVLWERAGSGVCTPRSYLYPVIFKPPLPPSASPPNRNLWPVKSGWRYNYCTPTIDMQSY